MKVWLVLASFAVVLFVFLGYSSIAYALIYDDIVDNAPGFDVWTSSEITYEHMFQPKEVIDTIFSARLIVCHYDVDAIPYLGAPPTFNEFIPIYFNGNSLGALIGMKGTRWCNGFSINTSHIRRGNNNVLVDVDYRDGQTIIFEYSKLSVVYNGTADTTPPLLEVISPRNNTVFVSSQVQINGTASDNAGVKRVEASVNDGPFQLATGTLEWTYVAALNKGWNKITVRATDLSNNSAVKVVYLGYVDPADYFPYYYFSATENYYPVSFYFDGDADVTNNQESYDGRRGLINTPYSYAHPVQDDNHFTLQYWPYYAYNDWRGTLLDHEHDWDSVAFVVFAKNDLTVPIEIRYARHYSMGVYSWDELEMVGTHPVAYVANGSHGAYRSSREARTRNLDAWLQGGSQLSPAAFNWYVIEDCGPTVPRTIDSATRRFCLPELLGIVGAIQPELAAGYWPVDFLGEGLLLPDAPWESPKWTQIMPFGFPDIITFGIHSPADIHVYDPLGMHVGMNYETGEPESQIPEATITVKPEGQLILVPNPIEGEYNVRIIGRENGKYDLSILRITEEHVTYEGEKLDIPISENETHSYIVGNAFTWTGEVVRSPPGGPATDAISNTFSIDRPHNLSLFAENKGLSGLKIRIISTTGYEYEYRHGFGGDKEFFGEVSRGDLPPGEYTISLAPYGQKGASAKFVFNVGR